jgi:hypothetical protein
MGRTVTCRSASWLCSAREWLGTVRRGMVTCVMPQTVVASGPEPGLGHAEQEARPRLIGPIACSRDHR